MLRIWLIYLNLFVKRLIATMNKIQNSQTLFH